MKPKEILIVGAGLSGLTAAIDLARAGVEVTVLEKEPAVGGSPVYHPSIHTTPMYFDEVERRTGLDLSPAFRELVRLWFVIHGERYLYRGGGIYNVERGPRESSVDHFLYRIALAEGVRFRFGEGISGVDDVPPGSIIATGLYAELLRREPKLPRLELFGYSSALESERYADEAFLCMDRFSNDYFYVSGMNGLLYGLLFARGRPFKPYELSLCEEYAAERLGVEFGSWGEIDGGFFLRPTPLLRGRILAGGFAGVIDPAMGFGIYGACLGGRAAALTVIDRERGLAEFRRLTRWFTPALLYWVVFNGLPARHHVMNLCIRGRRWIDPVMPFISNILPGNREDWIGKALRELEFKGPGRPGAGGNSLAISGR